jgi:hypothetical protein
LGKDVGTKFGTEDTQKIAFHNQTPCIRANHITDPNDAPSSYDQNQVNNVVTAVKAILVALENKGILKTL